MRVAVLLGIKHQTFLHELQLVNEEHEYNREHKGDERGVKGNTKALGNPGNIPLNRPIGLGERSPYAAYRTYETD